MIEKLVLGEIWTGDLPIFNPDVLTSALTSAPSLTLEYVLQAAIMFFERDLKLLYRFFESVDREKTLQ